MPGIEPATGASEQASEPMARRDIRLVSDGFVEWEAGFEIRDVVEGCAIAVEAEAREPDRDPEAGRSRAMFAPVGSNGITTGF